MGAAFLLFLPMSGTTGKAVPARLVVAIMAAFEISELLISPIGPSVTTKLAPEAFRAQMMALEFAYFGIIGGVAVLAGGVVFAIAGWIRRLMEGVHQGSSQIEVAKS